MCLSALSKCALAHKDFDVTPSINYLTDVFNEQDGQNFI